MKLFRFLIFMCFIYFVHSFDTIAQWVQTDGAYGGNVHCLAVTPDGSNLLAGTDGGVLVSNDKANNWDRSDLFYSVWTFAQTAAEIFAGTDGDGVFRSADGGYHWDDITSDLVNTGVRSLAVMGTDLYAGTFDGVFLLSDGGMNWDHIGLDGILVESLAAFGSDLYAVTSDDGIFKYMGGDVWDEITYNLTGFNVATLIGSSAYLYVGTYGNGVYKLINDNWQPVGEENPLTCPYVAALWYDGTNIYAGTTCNGDVFRLATDDSSWDSFGNTTYPPVYALVSDDANLYAGTYGGGVFRATNYQSQSLPIIWDKTINGFEANMIFDLHQSVANLFAAASNGIFIFLDAESRWDNILPDKYMRAIAANEEIIAAGSGDQGFFGTSDNGSTWYSPASGLTTNNINSLIYVGTKLIAGSGNEGVFISEDNGVNWDKPIVDLTYSNISCMTFQEPLLFAGTSGGGVFISIDEGATWTEKNSGLGDYNIRSLVIKGNTIYAGTSNSGLFSADISDPGNFSWNQVSGFPNDLGLVNALAVGGSTVFAGTRSGVLVLNDDGITWSFVNDGLTITFIRSLEVSGSDLYAGTFGSGVMRRPISEMTGITPVIPPIVTVPNGYEKWTAGTQQNITWTSSGIDNFMIEYSTDKGENWSIITPSTPASTGSFPWTVPDVLSTQCSIRISDVNDETLYDESDNYFMIYKSTGLFVATENNFGITTTNGQFSCAWGDYDGDGYLDLYIPGAAYPNTLYRNDGGNDFVDVGYNMGLTGPFNGAAIGAIWADFNGDGSLDLLGTDNGLKLYRNDGNTFNDISTESNLNVTDLDGVIIHAVAADYDRDGDLDIAYAGALANALPIRILRNDNGFFTDAATDMNITESLESWTPEWVDVNNDGYLDLWMPTIRSESGCTLLLNQEGQLVVSDPGTTGIEANSAITSCWGDFNNDGYMDLFLVPWSGDNDGIAKLYQNSVNGTFTDVALDLGINYDPSLGPGSGSRGSYWGDYDNDGDLDLLIGGYAGRLQELYRNDGDHFTEVGAETGAGYFGSFRNAVFIDFDNDGDLDIYYNEGQSNGGGQSKLLLRNSGNSNHWIGIVLEAFGGNSAGIGARVMIEAGSKIQFRDIQGGGGGMTNGNLRAHFGLGSQTEINTLVVIWPDGNIKTYDNLTIDSYNVIKEVDTSISAEEGETATLDDLEESGTQINFTGGTNGAVIGISSSDQPPFEIPPLLSSLYTNIGKYIDVTVMGNLEWPVVIKIYYTYDELLDRGIVESDIQDIYYYSEQSLGWRSYSDSGEDDQGRGTSTTIVHTENVTVNGIEYAGYVETTAYHLTPIVIGATVKTLKERYDEAIDYIKSLPNDAFKKPAFVRKATLIAELGLSYLFQKTGKLKNAAECLVENVLNHLTQHGNNGNNVWITDEGARLTLIQMVEDILKLLQRPQNLAKVVQENMMIETAKEQIPTEYVLYQNYPNPFNPSTTINYQIPKASNVELKVYNMLGQEIATLVSRFHQPGYYQVQWLPNEPSGVYIARLEYEGKYIMRKMLFIK